MGEKTIRINRGYIAATVRNQTLQVEDRSVEVCWTTGSAVKRYSYDEGYYIEELQVDAKSVRLDRFETMSLLDNHKSYSMNDRLGTVVPGSVRFEKGMGLARIRFSKKAEAETLWQDLVDGHPIPISVGYRVHTFQKTEGDAGTLPKLLALDWEPMELSATPIPADAGAASRSEPSGEDVYTVLIRQDPLSSAAAAATQKELPMDKRKAAKTLKGTELDNFGIGAGYIRNANEADEAYSARMLAGFDAEDATRSAQDEALAAAVEAARVATEQLATRGTTTGAQPSTGTPPSIGTAAHRTETSTPAFMTPAQVEEHIRTTLQNEETRRQEIENLARSAGIELGSDTVRNAISQRMTVDAFRSAMFNHMVEQQSRTQTFPHVETRGMQDGQETTRRLVANAILHRHGMVDTLEDGAREWRMMPAMDIARELLRARGQSARGSLHQIASRALHSTSDFPLILQDVTNRVLLAKYAAAENTFEAFATMKVLNDYRETKVLDVGSMPDLLLKGEHGEFKSGTLKESEEAMSLKRYGRKVGFTHEMMVNDYLNQFIDGVARWGEKVGKLEGDIMWGAIISNAKLKDGKGLFHADHKNLAASGTALDLANIKVARLAMRKQTDIDGEPIGMSPNLLFTGSNLEITAQQLVTAPFNPVVLGETIPPQIRSIKPMYESRLDKIATDAWFLFAEAASTGGRGIHHLRLLGEEQPTTNERIGFDVEGIEYTIAHSFGVGLTDYRWAYKNPGLTP